MLKIEEINLVGKIPLDQYEEYIVVEEKDIFKTGVVEFLKEIHFLKGNRIYARIEKDIKNKDNDLGFILKLITLVQISYHEASHLAVEYCLNTEEQSSIRGILLNGHNDLPVGCHAAVHSAIKSGAFLSFQIASILGPLYFEPEIKFINRDRSVERRGKSLSEGDLVLLDKIKKGDDTNSFTHNLTPQEVSIEDNEARMILNKYQLTMVNTINEIAPLIIDCILSGHTFIAYDALKDTIKSA